MAPIAETDPAVKFLLTILKHTELPKLNYAAIAEEAGIKQKMNAQRRFKALVEKAGFALVNGQVVSADGATVAPKRTTAKKTATPASKKRKAEEMEGDGADEDGNGGGEEQV